MELDDPCPPSTHAAVKRLFQTHLGHSLDAFRTRLDGAVRARAVTNYRTQRTLKSAVVCSSIVVPCKAPSLKLS